MQKSGRARGSSGRSCFPARGSRRVRRSRAPSRTAAKCGAMPGVLFIGTGAAFGSGGRRNSAILVREAGRTLLLDCGPTTLSGLKQLGVDPLEIDAVALSHFHGDHIAGFPFLLLDYVYAHPRERPMAIIGPPGVESRLTTMACAR